MGKIQTVMHHSALLEPGTALSYIGNSRVCTDTTMERGKVMNGKSESTGMSQAHKLLPVPTGQCHGGRLHVSVDRQSKLEICLPR